MGLRPPPPFRFLSAAETDAVPWLDGATPALAPQDLRSAHVPRGDPSREGDHLLRPPILPRGRPLQGQESTHTTRALCARAPDDIRLSAVALAARVRRRRSTARSHGG